MGFSISNDSLTGNGLKGFQRGKNPFVILIDRVGKGDELTHDRDVTAVGIDHSEHDGVHEGGHQRGLATHEDALRASRQGQQNTRGEHEKEENKAEHFFYFTA